MDGCAVVVLVAVECRGVWYSVLFCGTHSHQLAVNLVHPALTVKYHAL